MPRSCSAGYPLSVWDDVTRNRVFSSERGRGNCVLSLVMPVTRFSHFSHVAGFIMANAVATSIGTLESSSLTSLECPRTSWLFLLNYARLNFASGPAVVGNKID